MSREIYDDITYDEIHGTPPKASDSFKLEGKTLAQVKSEATDGMPLGNMQYFTSSGTFVVPSGVTKIWIEGAGAGGNNQTAVAMAVSGAGGGGFQGFISVSPGQSISVIIGASPSGVTSFGGFAYAHGGASAVAPNGGVFYPPVGGIASMAHPSVLSAITRQGEDGKVGYYYAIGGQSPFVNGGGDVGTTSTDHNSVPNSGAGAYSDRGNTQSYGASGYLIVKW